MSLLWTRAMSWIDDDRETDPEGMEGDRDTRPYHVRREDYVDHISDVHDVPRHAADRALEKIENHSSSLHGMAPAVHFGFSDYRPLSSDYEHQKGFRTTELWDRSHVGEVPLKGMKASQSWVRPSGVAHNLFHPGKRGPWDETTEGDPDYDPEWDKDTHEESDRDFEETEGRQPRTDLPRFLRHNDGSYTCLDGHHRVAADLLLGKESTPGYVIHEKQLARSAAHEPGDTSWYVHDSRDYPAGGSAYFPWADSSPADASDGSDAGSSDGGSDGGSSGP